MNHFSRLVRLLALALLVAAVVQELRKPAADRSWRGQVAGFIPYDLRRPTPARFLSASWNAEDANVLVGTPFGVGWTINFHPFYTFLRGRAGGL